MHKRWTNYGLTFVYLICSNDKSLKMAITFFIQSKKNPANIYIRIREGKEIDAKAKTNQKVNIDSFKKGKVKLFKIPPKSGVEVKKHLMSQNVALNDLQQELNNLIHRLTNLLNNRESYETINSVWLKNAVNPSKEKSTIPNTLVEYFNYYLDFKRKSLRKSTIKKLGSIKSRIESYERDMGKIYIQEINKRFSLSLQKWCDDNNYDHNTKVKTIKVVLTICNHAIENGITTNPELQNITKGLKYKKSVYQTLSINELEQIAKTKIDDERLDVARDWLIISCFTAQRVSDTLVFNKKNIIFDKDEEEYFLEIIQEKTEEPILIPLDDDVKKILDKRDGDFPPVFSSNKGSNDTIYNKLIKEVCKVAGIDEIVNAKIKNSETNRYEIKEVPKYKSVSSHIGRRSYATNFYGFINTALLRSATGHSSDKQFMDYVRKKPKRNALQLAKQMRKHKQYLKEERKRLEKEKKNIKAEMKVFKNTN